MESQPEVNLVAVTEPVAPPDPPAPAAPRVYLSREALLAAPDVPVEDLYVPEFGGYVRVKGLTAAERDDYEFSLVKTKGKNVEQNFANARARLVALAVVDSQGQRLFSDRDVALLGTKSAVALTRIWDVARRLAGMSEEDVEELTGNSNGQDGASPSA